MKVKLSIGKLFADFKRGFLVRVGNNKEIAKLRKQWLDIISDRNQWRYLEASLTLLLIILLTLFALKPTVFAISRLLGQLKARRTVAVKMQNKINRLVTAQDVFFNFQNKISLLNSYYPQQPQILEGSSQLIGLALKNNLEVETFSTGQWQLPTKTAVPGKIGFNLAANGCFFDVENFLKDLFIIRRAVTIERYSLMVAKTGERHKFLKCGKETLKLSLEGYLGFSPLGQGRRR